MMGWFGFRSWIGSWFTGNCPSPETVAKFAESTDGLTNRRLQQHVVRCARCQQLVEEARRSTQIHSMGATTDQNPPGPGNAKTAVKPESPPADAAPSPISTASGVQSPPQQIGSYQILKELSRGGMGVVYAARQLKTERVVALKMILAGPYASPDDLLRFDTEIRAHAALHHPNIVRIYEVGEFERQPYFSMEYCGGGSLSSRQREPLSTPRWVAQQLEVLAKAIAHAHKQGIYHRDLKPGNIFLTATGELKVGDFGLVKNLADPGNTQTGAVLGTPSYMAPEQARGESESVDARTDVYALGAIGYALLTGRAPFAGDSAMNILRQVQEENPISIRRLNPTVAADLETICHKCLEKDPDQRYPSASDLADELDRWIKGFPITARPVGLAVRGWRWARRNPLIASLSAAVLVAIALGLATSSTLAVLAENRRATAEQTSDQLLEKSKELVAANTQLVDRGVQLRDALSVATDQRDRANSEERFSALQVYAFELAAAQEAWSEGNAKEAWKRLRACRWDLRGWEHDYLHSVMTQTPTLWGHRAAIAKMAYSPDGDQLASVDFANRLIIWKVAARAAIHTIDHCDQAFQFSRDGRSLVVGQNDGSVQWWNTRSWRIERQLSCSSSAITSLNLSPQNDLIVIGAESGEVQVWSIAEEKQVAELPGHYSELEVVRFTPDGKGVISQSKAKGVNSRPVKYWKIDDAKPIAEFQGFAADGVFTPDGDSFLCYSQGFARLDLATGKLSRQPISLKVPVKHMAYDATAERTATFPTVPVVHTWNTNDASLIVGIITRTEAHRGIFLPDNERLVTVGMDCMMRTWHTQHGHAIQALQGHQGSITEVEIHPGGMQIATGSHDRSIKLWNEVNDRSDSFDSPKFYESVVLNPSNVTIYGEQAKPEPRSRMKAADVERLLFEMCPASAVSADGKWLLVGDPSHKAAMVEAHGGGNEFVMCDINTRAVRHRFTAEEKLGGCVAFSPDESMIAASVGKNGIRLYDSQTGELLGELPSPGQVRALAFTANGETLLAGGHAKALYWLNVETMQREKEVRGFPDTVTDLKLSPNEQLVACCSGNEVFLIDRDSGVKLQVLRGRDTFVMNCAFSPDGRRLASVGVDRLMHVWDVETGVLLLSCPSSSPLLRVAFGENGESIFGLNMARGLALSEWRSPRRLGQRLVQEHSDTVLGVAMSPQGNVAASYGEDQAIRLWSPHTGRRVASLDSHQAAVLDAAFSRAEHVLASCSRDGVLKLWDLNTYTERFSSPPQEEALQAVAFSPNGKQLATGDSSGQTTLWNVQTGKEVDKFRIHNRAINCIAFDEAGKRVYTGSVDGTIGVWRLGETKRVQWQSMAEITDLQFDPATKTLVSADAGGKVIVWNTTTGTKTHEFPAHQGKISGLAVSADGQWIATTGADDDVISVHRLSDGRLVRKQQSHRASALKHTLVIAANGTPVDFWEFKPTSRVFGVALNEEASELFTAHENGIVSVWDLPETSGGK